jgi:hypothetical protein
MNQSLVIVAWREGQPGARAESGVTSGGLAYESRAEVDGYVI